MASAPKTFFRGATTVSASDIATVPASTQWILTNLLLVNTDTLDSVASVNLAGTPLVYEMTLVPGSQYVLDCRQTLAATEAIQAFSTGGSCAVHATGVEVTL